MTVWTTLTATPAPAGTPDPNAGKNFCTHCSCYFVTPGTCNCFAPRLTAPVVPHVPYVPYAPYVPVAPWPTWHTAVYTISPTEP